MTRKGKRHLPPEILQMIFSNLCIHCSNPLPLTMPDLNTSLCRVDKLTLSHASRASKALRNVAQPIFFHYFVLNTTSYHSRARRLRAQLLKFLRVLCVRPDLAHAVRALGLRPGKFWKDAYPIDHITWRAFGQIDLLQFKDYTREKPAIISLSLASKLLLRVCPNVEYLRAVVPPDQGLDWAHLKAMPAMRVLKVVSTPNMSFRLVDLRENFRRLPNLTTLDLSGVDLDCKHGCDSDRHRTGLCSHPAWDFLPSSLKKISVDAIHINRLPHLFDKCPQVEDLEIHIGYSNSDWRLTPPPLGALEERRHSIRRLVINIVSWRDYIAFPSPPEMPRPNNAYYNVNMHFQNMKKLEYLGVDQPILECEVYRAGSVDLLSAALPESLRTLHIGFVLRRRTLVNQLHDLHEKKLQGRFENLSIVYIGLCSPWAHIEDVFVELQNMLAPVGIDLIEVTRTALCHGLGIYKERCQEGWQSWEVPDEAYFCEKSHDYCEGRCWHVSK
jgi:hypothetical protein